VVKIEEEEALKVSGERLLAAAKVRATTEEAEKVIPEREAELAAVEAELARHDEERKTIFDRLSMARITLMKERHRFAQERSGAEAVLLSNYDPRIDEAIKFFRDQWEGLLVKSINEQQRAGERNIFTERQKVIVYSNAAAIKNALAYCLAAINELEKMKLTPDLDAELIEVLQKGIPDANEMTEATGEKPLPGSKGVNPLHLLPSDSEMDWRMGKLNEKFKKVMRT
jgi:hypothetical protein